MIVRVVITDGRRPYLEAALRSFDEQCGHKFDRTIVVDDSGDRQYSQWLEDQFDEAEFIRHPARRGLAQAIRTAWSHIDSGNTDYVFHQEDDWTYTEPVDIPRMVGLLKAHRELANLVLLRGPSSGRADEQQAGGLLNLYPDEHTQQDGYVEHRMGFWLQPCVYPSWVTNIGWPEHGSEGDFTNTLLSHRPETRFGWLGNLDDPPRVVHVGDCNRSAGWVL